jgi:hypothetical protein
MAFADKIIKDTELIKRASETYGVGIDKIRCLKLVQPYFNDVLTEKKKAELRKADKPFSEGDYFVLGEYDTDLDRYTGSAVLVRITHILKDVPKYGLDKDYVIWSFDFIGVIKI